MVLLRLSRGGGYARVISAFLHYVTTYFSWGWPCPIRSGGNSSLLTKGAFAERYNAMRSWFLALACTGCRIYAASMQRSGIWISIGWSSAFRWGD
jgi:hypothetical protein